MLRNQTFNIKDFYLEILKHPENIRENLPCMFLFNGQAPTGIDIKFIMRYEHFLFKVN